MLEFKKEFMGTLITSGSGNVSQGSRGICVGIWVQGLQQLVLVQDSRLGTLAYRVRKLTPTKASRS